MKKALNQSKQQHSQGKEAEVGVLPADSPEQVHPIKFDVINADLVKRATEQEVEQDHQEWMPMGGEKF